MLDIGPYPEWIVPGQQVVSKNGELTAYIGEVKIESSHDVVVFLSWTPDGHTRGQFSEPWSLHALTRHWKAVV